MLESNQRPSAYEAGALTAELIDHKDNPSPAQIGEYPSTTECTRYLTNKMNGSVFPVCGK